MTSKYTRIYADYNATTPCDQRVVDTMMPYFNMHFGNPSSSHHAHGWLAMDAIDSASETLGTALGVSPGELVFTSGSTESINSILKGLYLKGRSKRNHIITSKAEHKAVLDTCQALEAEGAKVTYLDVTANGLVDTQQLKQHISDTTLVVAIMLANNETGVIQPLQEISELCKTYGSFLFSDATQALGKIPLDDFFDHVDFACFSSHKVYGPKGVGLTYIKDGNEKFLEAFMHGGGQQRKLRGGTYNTPGIVGMARAVELSVKNLEVEFARLRGLRDQLQEGLSAIEETVVNGAAASRLPNTLNVSFKYVDGEGLLRALSKQVSVSNGSACNSANVNPSHVLTAMGIPEVLAFSSIRFSLGRYTTQEEVEQIIAIVSREVAAQREANILWERRKR
ncbi:cysteine desulfurase [Robertkochia marina]|uniref:Cysteine desulfurase n=1 Tax=Robertkochia marina TaxID=1227945 RepID=A0A4S3M1G0_9FLAO|nr:cysteine desulfurase family protein [Robertkochia marina]THD68866.1 cysteine desulfurase [Robertkochia marina]TRZ41112.1 cysteine desulfurase [Robertkochia marina]